MTLGVTPAPDTGTLPPQDAREGKVGQTIALQSGTSALDQP